MKNTNIVISLDTRRAKSDGSFPLIMRLGHLERTTSIPLGISLKEKDWDSQNKVVKKSYTGTDTVSRLNNFIQKRKSDAMDIILKLQEAGQLQTMSVTELRSRIDQKDESMSFFQFAQNQVQELIKANRVGTARSYKGVISVLKTFVNEKDLKFQEITFPFLTRFETDHKARGNQMNGLAVYMRTIRAIFNKAIKSGIVVKELYPFDKYKIKTTPTEKRALDNEYIAKIVSLKLDPIHPCFHARNYFLTSYMAYGMNFKDMACLKRSNISNGRVVYRRNKTGKLYDIRITEGLKEILDYYLTSSPASEYVFPIIKRESALLLERDVQWARKRYNKKLKELAKLCGIESNLTSYVSRHSFATQAMMKDIPLNAISAMLGHSNLKTTEIYLKSLPSNLLDQYNAKLLAL